MRVLRNLTLHRQGAVEQGLAAEAGFELEIEPFGVDVSLEPDGFNAAAMLLTERLTRCTVRGVAVLIGGHTGLWILALDILSSRGVRRPDLYYFETLRRRDANDGFVFVPERILKLPEAARQR